MNRQYIISISREYGSGGHDIGTFLAGTLGIPMYDKSLTDEIAQELDMDEEELEKYDERAKNRILTRTVGEYSNAMEDVLEEKQVEFLRGKAESGESFVIVGRRGKEILSDFPGMISIFITADEDFKVKRIMAEIDADEETAKARRAHVDHQRKAYHNRHSDHDWGESRYYDLIINSSRLGVDGAAEELLHYIKARIAAMGAE